MVKFRITEPKGKFRKIMIWTKKKVQDCSLRIFWNIESFTTKEISENTAQRDNGVFSQPEKRIPKILLIDLNKQNYRRI